MKNSRAFWNRRRFLTGGSVASIVAGGFHGTNPERLVSDEARFLEAVEKGIAAAERGDFIEEEEMDARIERMFKP